MPLKTYSYAVVPRAASTTRQPGVSLRPMVPIALRSENGTFYQTVGLVDSGADACIFPLRFARFLKLDLAELPRGMTSGVGSSANPTYYASIAIDLGDGLSFQTLAGFSSGLDRIGFGLLGQEGFFENFDVEFQHKRRQFMVTPS